MAGQVRQPRGYLSVNGARIDVISIEIHLSREAKSDTLHAEFPMTDLPEGLDTAYWAEEPEIEVKGYISGDDAGSEALFTGKITQVRLNWLKRTIDINGHDKSRDMMEKKSLSESFKNKKGKEIIEEVAKRNGLKVQSKADTLKAGRNYDIDHVHHPRELTDWDLVNYLADAEGLTASLQGDTLYLGQDGEDDLPTLSVEYEEPTPQSVARGTSMSLSGVHNKDLTKKATVKVKSWDHRTKKMVEGKKTLKSTGQGDKGTGITYEYQAPGLKQDRASRIAEKRLRRATKQERAITLEIPGVDGVTARMGLDLTGTGTAFDQPYDIESVEHRLNEEEGWRLLVSAKAATKGREMTDGD